MRMYTTSSPIRLLLPPDTPSAILHVTLGTGSMHDDVCMRLFAAGLLAAGLKDEAAAVYYSLLQGGADRAQQVLLCT